MRTRPLLPSVCQSPSGESGSVKSCFALAGSAASCVGGGGGATGVSTGFSITTVLAGSDFVTGDGTDCVVAARSVFVAGAGCGGATVSAASLVAGEVTAGGAAGAG